MNLQTNCFYTFQPVKTGDKCCAFLLFISKKELLCSLMFVISVQDSYEEFAYSELSIKRVGVVAGQKGVEWVYHLYARYEVSFIFKDQRHQWD